MDKFNVIDQVSNIDDLERDFEAWSNMPYVFRRHSDDDCIRKHGMTNLQYYEKKKAELLNGYRSDYIGEGVAFNADFDDYVQKCDISKQYSASPNIVILIPNSYDNEDDLLKDFERYQYLGFKSRLMSDEYSRQIWGYTVTDIFTHEKERLNPSQIEADTAAPVDESANDIQEFKRIISHIEHLAITDDKIT